MQLDGPVWAKREPRQPEAVSELPLHVPQHHERLLLRRVGVGDAVESNHRQRAWQAGKVGRRFGVKNNLALKKYYFII